MSTQIQNPRQFFLQELGEMLYVEQTLARDVLPQLCNEVKDDRLRQGMEAHLQQTQQHASNLERCFQVLGEQPQAQESPALQGLKQAHDQRAPMIQADQLRDFFDCEAAAKTEHLEVAAYRGLISMASQIGDSEVQQLLEQNCRQDEQAMQQLENMGQQLSRSSMV
jgi:ferritin-like metal-binding protein YciE